METSKLKQDNIDLKAQFPKDVRNIIKKVKDRHRSSNYLKRIIKKEILLLIATYQVKNNKHFTINQMNMIISMFMQIQKYSKSKLVKSIFIRLTEIVKATKDFTPNYNLNLSNKEIKYLEQRIKFEELNGLD